jgi:SAM-dependent methyltransferase
VPTRHQVILEKELRWKRRLARLIPSYRFSNDIYENAVKKRLGEGVRWVDLGCGRNELLHELADSGALAFGLDAHRHPHLIHMASRFVMGDAAALPFGDESLDMVSANDVFEHLADPATVLSEIHRALKPNGYLILRTPNALHPLSLTARLIPEGLKKRLIYRVFGVSSQDVFPTLYRTNTLRRLHKLCRETGFRDVKLHAVEDVHTAYSLFFFPSLLYYFLVRFKPLSFLRSNLVVETGK